MGDSATNAKKIDGKTVRGTFSDGTNSVMVDYQGETTVLLPLEEREFTEFVSQEIAEDSITGKPKFGSISQNIVFSEEAYLQFENWYENETELTYTVSGLFSTDRTYDGIYISIPEPPKINPEMVGYITNSIGIKSIKRPGANKEN